MILYLAGISCVGKTTIGKMLAEKIDSVISGTPSGLKFSYL